MKNNLLLLFVFLITKTIWAQTPSEKTVKQQHQIWTAFVSTTKLNQHLEIVADLGTKWNNFFENDNITILRGLMNYKINSDVSVGGGYAHAWAAPTKPDWHTYADENRFFEQLLLNSKLGNTKMFQRIRIEQRWQEQIVNDKVSNDIRFTDRIRYMLYFNIPVFEDKNLPTLATYDEIFLQFGKEVVYNTFDQNRFFIGIRQSINPKWSYEFGYLNAYQQKYSGYQYEMTHMLRLFVYLNTEVKHKNQL